MRMSKRKDDLERLDAARAAAWNPPFALTRSWRERSSSMPVVELKYIQEDIQSFVNIHIGKGYKVIWSGQEKVPGFTNIETKVITLSYGPIAGQAPAKPELVDVVGGIGIHEVGHVALTQYRPSHIPDALGHISNVLEDAWIDSNTGKTAPVLGAYIMRCRSYYKNKLDLDNDARIRIEHPKPISRNELIALWGNLALYRVPVHKFAEKRTGDDAEAFQKAIHSLTDITVKAIKGLNEEQKYASLLKQAQRVIDHYEAETAEAQAKYQMNQSAIDAQGATGDGADGSSGSKEESFEDYENSDDDLDNDIPEGEDESEQGEDEATEDGSGSGSGSDDNKDDGKHVWDSDPSIPDKDKDNDGPCGECGNAHCDTHSHMPSNSEGGIAPPKDIPEYEPVTCMEDMLEEMPPELAEKVWEAVEQDLEDVTEYAGGQFVMKKPHKASQAVVLRPGAADAIKEAFESRAHMNTITVPFQDSGRVSGRTLPNLMKGRTDLFEEEIEEDEIDLVLGLLIDCSSSISTRGGYGPDGVYSWNLPGGGQWDLIIQICEATRQAFEDSNLDLVIMGYRTGEALRMYEPGWDSLMLGDVHPAGSTPSVEGLRVLTHQLQKLAFDREDKIIIHLTDGMPNSGGGAGTMKQAVKDAEKKGWTVIGIGIQVPLEQMQGQYNRCFAVTDFKEVPDQIRKILERL